MVIRVIVIEDHPLMLKAVVQELEGHDDIRVVGTARLGSSLHTMVSTMAPNVVILDLGMPEGDFEPIAAVRALRQAHPNVQILVLTGYEEGIWVRELVAAGARGYVLKSDDLSLCLPEAVRRVHSGARFYSPAVTDKYFAYEDVTTLSGQEIGLLRLAAQGLSSARIGQELGLSEKTIRNYFTKIYDKLGVKADSGVNSRVAAIKMAREMGLLPDETM